MRIGLLLGALLCGSTIIGSAQAPRTVRGGFAATLLLPGAAHGTGGLRLAHATVGERLAATGALTFTPNSGRIGVRVAGAIGAGAMGWTAQGGLLQLQHAGTIGTGAFGFWLRRGVLTLTGSVERNGYAGLTYAAPGRPYVIGPVIHDTMSAPHDTLTAREAAERERGTLMLHGALSGVLAMDGAVRGLQWHASISHPLGRCCTDSTVSGLRADVVLEQRLTGSVAALLSAGTQARSATMISAHRGGYLSAGFALRPARHREPVLPERFTEFLVDTSSGGSARISVVAPGARRVALRGTPTGWQVVELQRERDGRWSAEVALPPGLHQLSIRRDGGEWVVPPGLAAGLNDYGEPVGILIVR